MLAQWQEMSAHQPWLITVPFGKPVVMTMALQSAGGQMATAVAVGKEAGVIVVLKVRPGVAGYCALHGQARFFEMVIAARGAAWSGFQTQVEALDDGRVGDHCAVLSIHHGRQCGKHRLIFAEHQQMGSRTVFEVVMQAFFLAEALNEVQVRFVVLNAVLALGIDAGELEAVGGGEQAMLFQYSGNDLLHRTVLKDPLVGAVAEASQMRTEGDRVTGQTLPRIALGDTVDQPVNATVIGCKLQKGRSVQQAFQIQS